MDTAMQIIRTKIIQFWGIFLTVVLLSACGSKRNIVPDYSQMSIPQLIQKLYEVKDPNCFTELVTRSFYDENIDIKKYARFVTDSLGGINALTFVGDTPEECMYYLALNEAYGIDVSYVEIFGLEAVKDVIDDYLYPMCRGSYWGDKNLDSLEKQIMEHHDTLAYLELRREVFSPELKKYAQFMADSASFAVAIQDMYNLISQESWNGYPMDSATFAAAYGYMEKGVKQGYLPSVFQKSLLLLTGAYLPQDTIEGKRLLDMCLKNPPCQTPFWRR